MFNATEDEKRAVHAWNVSCTSTSDSAVLSEQLHAELFGKGALRPAGWAALTCGRQFLKCGEHERARRYLLEAHGLFHLVGDNYGAGLVDAHIAALLASQGEAKRSLQFLKNSISAIGTYSSEDAAILHNIAAMCHWQSNEPHQAIAHLISELQLVQRGESEHRKWSVLGNIGVLLLELNELQLARLASESAWDLQSKVVKYPFLDPSPLTNLLLANLYLGSIEAASKNAALLRDLLDAHENLRGWRFWVNLLDFYGTTGDYENARTTFERATVAASRSPSPAGEICLKCAVASVQEAARDHRSALKTASALFRDPSPFLTIVGRIGLALICSRCTLALGDFTEAKKWNDRARQMGRRGLLDQVLTLQLQVALENKVHVKAPNLTEKERICLSLSANGQTSTDIGIKLGITPRTVNFHFSKILKKLGALNRQEAIAKAVRANLIKQ